MTLPTVRKFFNPTDPVAGVVYVPTNWDSPSLPQVTRVKFRCTAPGGGGGGNGHDTGQVPASLLNPMIAAGQVTINTQLSYRRFWFRGQDGTAPLKLLTFTEDPAQGVLIAQANAGWGGKEVGYNGNGGDAAIYAPYNVNGYAWRGGPGNAIWGHGDNGAGGQGGSNDWGGVPGAGWQDHGIDGLPSLGSGGAGASAYGQCDGGAGGGAGGEFFVHLPAAKYRLIQLASGLGGEPAASIKPYLTTWYRGGKGSSPFTYVEEYYD